MESSTSFFSLGLALLKFISIFSICSARNLQNPPLCVQQNISTTTEVITTTTTATPKPLPTYSYNNERASSWNEAYDNCAKKNMSMLYIETEEEYDIVNAEVTRRYPNALVWTAGTNAGSQSYYWKTFDKGNIPMNYTNWAYSYQSPRTSYVCITSSKRNNKWAWLDHHSPNIAGHHYICKGF